MLDLVKPGASQSASRGGPIPLGFVSEICEWGQANFGEFLSDHEGVGLESRGIEPLTSSLRTTRSTN